MLIVNDSLKFNNKRGRSVNVFGFRTSTPELGNIHIYFKFIMYINPSHLNKQSLEWEIKKKNINSMDSAVTSSIHDIKL